MVDESTRGQTKNFVLCYQFWNEKDQSPVAILAQLQHIPKCNADTVSETVIKNIQECGLEFKKCVLWVTDNTAYMSGEKKGAVQFAFGKLASNTGFSRQPHPYNLLYLAWKLHDGYDSSDKDKPLNINSQIIKDLYDTKQYLDRHIAHTEFANWFIGEIERNNTPKSYLNDWYLFRFWLLDSKLNIQIRCLVKFAEHFYEPLMQFIVGKDNTL
ncbi:2437_t:CDS:2 [Rhizophagus irregularis]|nr:2437_t:CDS:2 [Rhizophagus irregularis]